MPWLKVATRKSGSVDSHRAFINTEYVIYVGASADGCADFYLSSENWLCTEEKYDEIIRRIESLEDISG